jgi:hypothetical protein
MLEKSLACRLAEYFLYPSKDITSTPNRKLVQWIPDNMKHSCIHQIICIISVVGPNKHVEIGELFLIVLHFQSLLG